jgi:UDP-3-O-[3-hydroxymyristoyl] glucosamine N-acyltransferase
VAQIIVGNPQLALIKLVPDFYESVTNPTGVSPLAAVDPSAEIGADCYVGPFVAIGPFVKIGPRSVIHSHVVIYQGVKIGEEATIHAGAVIREDCEIGNRCTVLSGAVIGSEGFGYLPGENGKLIAVPQVGTIKIGDDVDIGANSCIDRAALGETVIGRGSKIDNLVQIGHNVQLGRSVIVCGQAGIAGSTKIADGVIVGGGAGIADHAEIVSGVRIGAASGVIGSISEPGDYVGFPALPIQQWRKINAQLRHNSKSSPQLGAKKRGQR